MLPPITVVMTLFIPPLDGPYGGMPRLKCAAQTIMSWGRHLKYDGELRLYVANDSVSIPEGIANDMAHSFSPWPVVVGHTQGQGLGGALNKGLQYAWPHSPLAAYVDDSYSLVQDYDITPWAKVLMRQTEYEDQPADKRKWPLGAVSLMPPRPGQDGGTCLYSQDIRTEGVAGIVFEKRGYVWNGRPFLYHKRFFDRYGYTPEGVGGYEWESQYADHVVATPGPQVLYGFNDPFQHVWSVLLGNAPPGWTGEKP